MNSSSSIQGEEEMRYLYNQEIERQRVPCLFTAPPTPDRNPQNMPDFNVRVTANLTSWHEWQPFGLAPADLGASFGISITYSPADAAADQQLALETCDSRSELLSPRIRELLQELHEAVVALASLRLNEMPYQLPIF